MAPPDAAHFQFVMRIVAGEARGRKLSAPRSKLVRPTSDRVREAVFNTLGSLGAELEGACVADLFAGTGALGLEAISRGAKQAIFMDNSPQALAALGDNITSLGWQEHSSVYPLDVMSTQAQNILESQYFDLVFCDPPYVFDSWAELLGKLNCGLLVAESDTEIDIKISSKISSKTSTQISSKSAAFNDLSKPDWEIRKIKQYGATVITIIAPIASKT